MDWLERSVSAHRRVGGRTQFDRRRRDADHMVIYMLLAGASYALAALLAQALGPRRPEYPADEPARRSIRAR